MKELKEIKGEKGSIRERVLHDANGEISYIKDILNGGCVNGSCRGLIYYSDTHAFYNEFAGEIDEILADCRDAGIMTRIDIDDTRGDLRNYLAWFAYEYQANEIMREINPNY